MKQEPNAPFSNIFSQLSHFWQAPAAYWQTVASIMNQRAQVAERLLQTQTACAGQLAGCKSFPEMLGVMGQCNAQWLTELTNLNISTNQQRQHLWAQWQLLATRMAPQTNYSVWPAAVPQAAEAPQNRQSAKPAAATVTPATQPAAAPEPIKAKPTMEYSATQPTAMQPDATAVAQAEVPNVPTSVPTSAPTTSAPQPAASAHPAPFIISRTGDAAVNRANGAAMAVASATRRSVAAGRSQRKGLARAR